MNKRVNELIKSIPDLKYDASTGMFETDRRALYDFAELIVRECAGICEKDKKGFPNSDSVKQGLADMIKQHFGVE